MLLLVPYHAMACLKGRDESLAGLEFATFFLHLWRMPPAGST